MMNEETRVQLRTEAVDREGRCEGDEGEDEGEARGAREDEGKKEEMRPVTQGFAPHPKGQGTPTPANPWHTQTPGTNTH